MKTTTTNKCLRQYKQLIKCWLFLVTRKKHTLNTEFVCVSVCLGLPKCAFVCVCTWAFQWNHINWEEQKVIQYLRIIRVKLPKQRVYRATEEERKSERENECHSQHIYVCRDFFFIIFLQRMQCTRYRARHSGISISNIDMNWHQWRQLFWF